MPPEKKPEKSDKPAPAPSGGDPFVEIVSILVGALAILYILNSVVVGITSSSLFSHGLYGLTPQGIIFYHTRPIASLDNPFQAKVVALHNLPVFNDPGEH